MSAPDERHMIAALELARKGYGRTSPNPMVGAVLVKGRVVIGKGWHRKAGGHHAEVSAINDAVNRDYNIKGSTLYVTLEPCSTVGRTGPCTQAIIESGVARVVVGAIDPSPKHCGRAFRVLTKAGIEVRKGLLANVAKELNVTFNHWVKAKTPYTTLKSAMTLDGKIATSSGESKWITGEGSRREGLRLRKGSDAVLVGINTVLADDPSLLARGKRGGTPLRRIILDSKARTPLDSKVVTDEFSVHTSVVVLRGAPAKRTLCLRKKVEVIDAPERRGKIDLKWLMKRLGKEGVLSLLVEGGGGVNASFLQENLVHKLAFFYAPKIMGGDDSYPAVAGLGISHIKRFSELKGVEWRRFGSDLLLTAELAGA